MKVLLACGIETAINPSSMDLTNVPILLNGTPVGVFKGNDTMLFWVDFDLECAENADGLYVSCANIIIPKTKEYQYRIKE